MPRTRRQIKQEPVPEEESTDELEEQPDEQPEEEPPKVQWIEEVETAHAAEPPEIKEEPMEAASEAADQAPDEAAEEVLDRAFFLRAVQPQVNLYCISDAQVQQLGEMVVYAVSTALAFQVILRFLEL